MTIAIGADQKCSASGCRTMTVDPKTHRIYLCNRGTGNNGFKVLVFGIDDGK